MARLVFLCVFEAFIALGVCASGVAGGGLPMPAYVQQYDELDLNSFDVMRSMVDWELVQSGAGTVCLGCNGRIEMTNFDATLGLRLDPDRYLLHGDVDVRIDFSLPASGVQVGEERTLGLALEQAGTGTDLIAIEYANIGGNRRYRSGGEVVGTTVFSGKLRVRRTGAAMLVFYWDGVSDEWVLLDVQISGYTGALSFVVWTDESATSGTDYTAIVDNIAVSYPADECAQAQVIEMGQPVLFDATLSTTSAFDPVYTCRTNGGLPAPGRGDNSQWYRFTAPTHPVTVYTCGSFDDPFEIEDSLLAVYEGGCGGLVEIACGDDECDGFFSSIRLDSLVAGQEYLIQISRNGTGTWPDIVLRIDPAVVYVDDDIPLGSGISDGDSWASAYRTLSAALQVIELGQKPGRDEIWVAEGRYVPGPGGPEAGWDRHSTFELPDGIAVRGGFPDGGTGTLDNRDPVVHPSVLSGDWAGDDRRRGGISITPIDSSTSNNSYHVVTVPETNGSYTIDGFVIEGGNADGAAGTRDAAGGGMLVLGEVEVVDCSFISNSAREGGGIALEHTLVGSSLSLDGCRFEANIGEDGAALMVGAVGTEERVGDALHIAGTTFTGNQVTGEGGSIARVYCGSFDVTVDTCVFISNTARFDVDRSACLRVGAPPLAAPVPDASVRVDSTFFITNALTDPGLLVEPGFVGFRPAMDVEVLESVFLSNVGLVNKGGGGAVLGGILRVRGLEDTTCRISDCWFERNSSGAGTVVVYGERTPFVIERCRFFGNRLAEVDGEPDSEASPGIFANFAEFGSGARSSLRVDNSLFVRNVDGQSGAAIAVRGEVDAAVYNSTLAANIGDAVTTNGLGGSLLMANSIVWGSINGNSYMNNGASPFAALFIACDLGGLAQVGNETGVVLDRCFESAPRFEESSGNGGDGQPGTTDDTFGDHRLGVGSPCIDTGDSRYPDPELAVDLDGNPRYMDAANYPDLGEGDKALPVVDLGAYEAPGGIASSCDGDPNSDGVIDVNDLSFVLFRLGDTGAPGLLDGDANGDGVVDVNDLSYVLFRLGDPC